VIPQILNPYHLAISMLPAVGKVMVLVRDFFDVFVWIALACSAFLQVLDIAMLNGWWPAILAFLYIAFVLFPIC
jgi:hypothetical protein